MSAVQDNFDKNPAQQIGGVTSGSFVKNPLRETTPGCGGGYYANSRASNFGTSSGGVLPARKEGCAIPIDFGNEKCLENHPFKKGGLLLVF